MDLFQIRDLRGGDLEEVVGIALTAWEPVFVSFRELLGDDLYGTVYPDWKADKERQIRSAAEKGPPVHFLVAESGGKVAGFASYILGPGGAGEIGNNAVDPAFQNRGIASSLYLEIRKKMKAAGMTYVKVTTGLDPSHAPARRAYEKAGFTRSIPMTTYYRLL